MNCSKAKKELDALLGGKLSGEKARSLRAHLADCPRCFSSLGETDRIEALTIMDDDIEPSADLEARFRARLDSHRQKQRTGRHGALWRQLLYPQRLAALGAMATLLLLALYLGQFRQSGTEPSPGWSEYSVADQVPLLEDMELIQNLELFENFDAIRKLSENGRPPYSIQ